VTNESCFGRENSMKLYGIWCYDTKDWLRELPSKVDDGGEAILVFTSKAKAMQRAAKNYGYDTYAQAEKDGWCSVREL